MRSVILATLLLIVAAGAMADGGVTVSPIPTPTTWRFSSLHLDAGAGTANPFGYIELAYLDAGGNVVRVIAVNISSAAELNSLLGQLTTAAPGENGTNAKKFRMRITKWLQDNSKVTGVTAES